MDLTEGGIRVPWIAHWPARIASGGVSAQPCMTMDWSATMLAAAGVEADPAYPLDGVSLLPVLDDPGRRFPRPLHWRMNHRGQRALRDGDWKYLEVDGHEYLFDLPADERERANHGSARRSDCRRCARLACLERDDADPRRRDGQPRLRPRRHAAALAPRAPDSGCYDRRFARALREPKTRHGRSPGTSRRRRSGSTLSRSALPARSHGGDSPARGGARSAGDARSSSCSPPAPCVRDATRRKRDASGRRA
jgi:hypothetical protein